LIGTSFIDALYHPGWVNKPEVMYFGLIAVAVALAIWILTRRKIEYAGFRNVNGKLWISIEKSDSTADQFKSFVEALTAQITKLRSAASTKADDRTTGPQPSGKTVNKDG
jgi:hypothetical protein